MKDKPLYPLLAILASCALLCGSGRAQSSAFQQFRAHNDQMRAVQPSWMAPLTQPDARLGQGIRISVSSFSFPGAHPIVYGNNQGINFIEGRRLQFQFIPPSYFRNHSAKYKDGWGNAAVEVKARIASGNAEHGNYAVTAVLVHAFAPRAYQNGALTSIYSPAIVAGHVFGRLTVLSAIGGDLPTGKIHEQGRGIDWRTTAQVHPTARTWFDVEDDALYNRGGPWDGKTQNFITPAAFYMVRRQGWWPAHTAVVFGCGMQIATSNFYFYNHNLISDMRIVF